MAERDYLAVGATQAQEAEAPSTPATPPRTDPSPPEPPRMDPPNPYLSDFMSTPSAEEGMQALAGEALVEGATIASPEQIEAALRTVHDPEIPVNIYDLGLIYECEVDAKGDCHIIMTLTAPACPVAGEMPQQVADAVAGVEGIGVVTVTLTWSPPWRPDLMSEDAKLALDFF